MRFVATSNTLTLGPGTYLRIVPMLAVSRARRPHQPDDQRVSNFTAEPPPDMPAGSEVMIGGKPCRVTWADGPRAIVDVGGQRWLMSHMTPAEMAWHPDAYEPGSLVQEWVMRERVEG